MPKQRTSFACSSCGAVSSKWAGQCPECEEWNTLHVLESSEANGSYAGEPGRILRLGEVSSAEIPRISTGISELDRSLGGGLVRGSVILVGGDPGIGKSTLLLQMLAGIAEDRCLYVSGEESAQQISLRGKRLGLQVDALRLMTETCVEKILATAEIERPDILVIDSIQTLHTQQLHAAAGSISQVRESAAALVRFAKRHEVIVFLIGHVTKDGQLAGPRVLEHMVDTVLYFEGDAGGRYRMLRAVKNRFGAVNELGVFAMQDDGLRPVANPSAIFLSRQSSPSPGSTIMVTREGTRPLLVEVQALVAESHAPQPRRVTLGLDSNRLVMLLAVLSRHGGIPLFDQDVFVNVVGGVRVTETAVDLPVLLAAISSFRNRSLDENLATFGEVGLSGEIRPVPNGEDRLAEAVKHGITSAIIPAGNRVRKKIPGLTLYPVDSVSKALALI